MDSRPLEPSLALYLWQDYALNWLSKAHPTLTKTVPYSLWMDVLEIRLCGDRPGGRLRPIPQMDESDATVLTRSCDPGLPDLGRSCVDPVIPNRIHNLEMVLRCTPKCLATSVVVWPACNRPIAVFLFASVVRTILHAFLSWEIHMKNCQ
jgi:hypothetical protein